MGEDSGRLQFGPFTLDTATGELTREGVPVPLQHQPARLLVLFAENPGSLITRDQIRHHLWDGTSVAFDESINYAIRQIRIALRDAADSPAFVQTIPRRGYRFMAAVRRAPSGSPEDSIRRRRLAWTRALPMAQRLAGAVLLTAGCFAAGFAVGRQFPEPHPAASSAIAAEILERLDAGGRLSREVSHIWGWVDAHLSGRATNCPYRDIFGFHRS